MMLHRKVDTSCNLCPLVERVELEPVVPGGKLQP